jgi:hypothetical protein
MKEIELTYDELQASELLHARTMESLNSLLSELDDGMSYRFYRLNDMYDELEAVFKKYK